MSLSLLYICYKLIYLGLVVAVPSLISENILFDILLSLYLWPLKVYCGYLLLGSLWYRSQVTDYVCGFGLSCLTRTNSRLTADLDYTLLEDYNSFCFMSPLSYRQSAVPAVPFTQWSTSPLWGLKSSSSSILVCYLKAAFAVRSGFINYSLYELDNVVLKDQPVHLAGSYATGSATRSLVTPSLAEVTMLPDYYWLVYNRRLSN
jgi:hypothetical protein